MHWTAYAIAFLFAIGVVVSFVLAVLCLTNRGVRVFIKEEEKEKYKEKQYLRAFAGFCLLVVFCGCFVCNFYCWCIFGLGNR